MQLFLVVSLKENSEKMHSVVRPEEEINFNENSTDIFARRGHQRTFIALTQRPQLILLKSSSVEYLK